MFCSCCCCWFLCVSLFKFIVCDPMCLCTTHTQSSSPSSSWSSSSLLTLILSELRDLNNAARQQIHNFSDVSCRTHEPKLCCSFFFHRHCPHSSVNFPVFCSIRIALKRQRSLAMYFLSFAICAAHCFKHLRYVD